MGISCAHLSCAQIAAITGAGGSRGARRMSTSSSSTSGAAAAGGPALVSETALGPLTIRKWKLGNGLEVILLPDPAATSVTYMTWYRVGSRDEDAAAQETGLAHLFEHLMFT